MRVSNNRSPEPIRPDPTGKERRQGQGRAIPNHEKTASELAKSRDSRLSRLLGHRPSSRKEAADATARPGRDAALDSIGDDMQLANTELQDHMSRFNQTMQLISNIMSKLNDARQQIVGKL